MKKQSISLILDKSGICVSILCMLHCLAVPLLLILGTDSLLLMIDQEWLELLIIITSFIIGSISFMQGFFQHRQHFIPILFCAGFLLIVNGESVKSTWVTVGLSIAGASIIAYAHYQNLRWKKYTFTG